MENNKKIDENLNGCFSVGTIMLILIVVCLMIAMCSCKAKKEFIEVEKWQHDTTTVVDTVRVKEFVTVHDSIFKTEYVTQFVKDSTQKDEAWQYTTYDPSGNITSQMNYTSSTHHGKTSGTASQSAQTSTSDTEYQKEENATHTQTEGHSAASSVTQKTEPQLSKWQRFIMGLGYTFLVALVIGITFGAMRLYGKYKKL